MPTENRRLAAILFADIQGYTSMMQADESAALAALQKFKIELEAQVPAHRGRIVQYYGDACLAIFDSSVDAVACAKTIQLQFRQAPEVPVRIGLHAGDVVLREGNVFGDAVNVASRIESIGVSGSVLLSSNVRHQIKNHPDFQLTEMGRFHFKNVEGSMTVYAMVNEGLVVPRKGELRGKAKTRSRTFQMLAAAAAAGLLLVLAFYFFGGSSAANATSDQDHRMIIFPFEVKGADELQYLGEGMVDLITTSLEDLPGFFPIDPNRVFNQLREAGEGRIQLNGAIQMSRELGASRFILGDIISLADQIQVTASKYDLEGDLLGKETVTGRQDQLPDLIDELTRKLISGELEAEGDQSSSLAALTSRSLPALKAYLLGEQAYRKNNFMAAFDQYSRAVELDSTFGMAWLKITKVTGWSPSLSYPGADTMLVKYKDDLAEKWRAFVEAQYSHPSGSQAKINAYRALEKKYGSFSELTFAIADFYFHYNPAYGRSVVEAKPYLLKAYQLDSINQEALIHLLHIAVIENDTAEIHRIIARTDSVSEFWPWFQQQLLVQRNTIRPSEIREVVYHPHFQGFWVTLFQAAPEDAVRYLERTMTFFSEMEDEEIKAVIRRDYAGLRGQEKKAFELSKKLTDFEGDYLQLLNYEKNNLILPAYAAVDPEYRPLEDAYPALLEQLKDNDAPWARYASWKYCKLIGKQDCSQLATRLQQMADQSGSRVSQSRFFYFSMLALEAHEKGDNDRALVWIDSAYQYSPGWFINQSAYLDKLFLQADIYENRGEYEKSIPFLENIPVAQGYWLSRGYATYRLTQLYELNGETAKALAKCDLFLKDYSECDDKYRPWWEEVRQRRDRLKAGLL